MPVNVPGRVLPSLTTVSVLAAVAALSSGCGVTDGGPHPGVAARLGGDTLSMQKVDDAVDDYCTLRASHPDAQPAARSEIRTEFVLGWAQATAVDHLAPDYDVALPPKSIDRAKVDAAWGELGTIDEDNYDTFEWLTWIQERLTTPVESLGSRKLEEENGESQVGQPAIDRGIALVGEWLTDHEPELNPVFGVLDEKTGKFRGDALSVPVSKQATAGAGDQDAAAIAKLPADQRCGPAAAPAQAPPA
ncbi:MAG TPA: hypothetical protein VNS81_06455 [Nocardioides sp.]|nr:hypothetical protein [Nocardioides sp.]